MSPPSFPPPLISFKKEYIPSIYPQNNNISYTSESESEHKKTRSKVKSFFSSKSLKDSDPTHGGKTELRTTNPLYHRNVFPQSPKNSGVDALISPRNKTFSKNAEEDKEMEEKNNPPRRTSSPALLGKKSLSSQSMQYVATPRPLLNSNFIMSNNAILNNNNISSRQNEDIIPSYEASQLQQAEDSAKQAEFEEFIRIFIASKKILYFEESLRNKVRQLCNPAAIGAALVNLQMDYEHKDKERKKFSRIVQLLGKDRETVGCVFHYISKGKGTFLREQKWYKDKSFKYIDYLISYFIKYQMDLQMFRSDNVMSSFTLEYLKERLKSQLILIEDYVEQNKFNLTPEIFKEFYIKIYTAEISKDVSCLLNTIKILVINRFKTESRWKEYDPELRALAAVSEVLFFRCLVASLFFEKSDIERIEFQKIISKIDAELKHRLSGENIRCFPDDSPFYEVAVQLFPAHKNFIERISRLLPI